MHAGRARALVDVVLALQALVAGRAGAQEAVDAVAAAAAVLAGLAGALVCFVAERAGPADRAGAGEGVDTVPAGGAVGAWLGQTIVVDVALARGVDVFPAAASLDLTVKFVKSFTTPWASLNAWGELSWTSTPVAPWRVTWAPMPFFSRAARRSAPARSTTFSSALSTSTPSTRWMPPCRSRPRLIVLPGG